MIDILRYRARDVGTLFLYFSLDECIGRIGLFTCLKAFPDIGKRRENMRVGMPHLGSVYIPTKGDIRKLITVIRR